MSGLLLKRGIWLPLPVRVRNYSWFLRYLSCPYLVNFQLRNFPAALSVSRRLYSDQPTYLKPTKTTPPRLIGRSSLSLSKMVNSAKVFADEQ